MKALLCIGLAIAMLWSLTDATAQAASGPEILTINVNLSLVGHTLIGSYVVQRGEPNGQANWTFNGMYDGKHGTAQGTVKEQWDTTGKGTVELLTYSSTGVPVELLPTRTLTVNKGIDGVFTVVGVPFAIKGTLNPPGAGNATIYITNAGKGTQVVASLPNTAGTEPVSSTGAIMVVYALGFALMCFGIYWRRAAGRKQFS